MNDFNKYNHRYFRYRKNNVIHSHRITNEEIKAENDYKTDIYTKIENNIRIDIQEFADFLRTHPTLAEYKINHEFLNRDKKRFRVQEIIKDIFIADFYLKPLRLAIEVDGSSHESKRAYDKRRDYFFINNGYNIIRIDNDIILDKDCHYEFFISDVIKYLTVLLYHKRLNPHKGEMFTVSPLAFPKPGQLEGFSELEKIPVKDCFKFFEILDNVCKKKELDY